MIEPYETEKQCSACRECKPLMAFSHGQGRCKACRSVVNVARRRIKRQRLDEIWPRKLSESLLDVGLKKWARGVEVNRGLLTWRLSA